MSARQMSCRCVMLTSARSHEKFSRREGRTGGGLSTGEQAFGFLSVCMCVLSLKNVISEVQMFSQLFVQPDFCVLYANVETIKHLAAIWFLGRQPLFFFFFVVCETEPVYCTLLFAVCVCVQACGRHK